MKRFALLLSFLAALSIVSCTSTATHYYLKSYGIYDENASVQVYTNLNKTVAYIPMKHIGPKQFYQNVTNKVDSLQAEGYIVFLEGTVLDTINFTKAQQDTIKLKMRHVTGVNVTKDGYLDTINNTMNGLPFKNRKGLVNQPKYKYLGSDSLKDRIVDIPKHLLIEEYEKKYGRIILNECDFKTKWGEKYTCSDIDRDKFNYILLDYRNKKLAEGIMNEKHHKIAILYGAAHEPGMFEELKILDTNWRKVLSAAEIREQNLYR